MKINSEKIFYFPKLNQKNYYILIFALCSLFRRVFPFLIESFDFGKVDKENFNKSCLFDMLSNFAGDILTGTYKLYLLFINCKQKKRKSEGNDNDKNNNLVEGEELENEGSNRKKIKERKILKAKEKKELNFNFF